MSVAHQGFKLSCDVNTYGNTCQPFVSKAQTERTAIAHAREAGWLVVHIRITKGLPKSKVRTKRLVCCPMCAWLVLP